jgi:hypothetical protein
MALRWTGKPHDTEELRDKRRDYKLIASAGQAAYEAARCVDKQLAVISLARAIHLSHKAQQDEGMPALRYHAALAAKYCGSGWGGYALYLFDNQMKRNRFLEADDMAVEPYMRSVTSSVLLWQ